MSNLSQFQPPGYVRWNAVKTASFTAEASNGYPIDTNGGAVTITLPASPAIGDTIELFDYSRTWQTNNVTININGNKLQKGNINPTCDVEGQNMTLVSVSYTHLTLPTNDLV